MYRILLVEDDPGIAQAVCAHLRQWELDARCVQNFRAVMEEFTAFDPQLVLLDISLPFFNGYHWCTQIRAVSRVPVVFLSSASENMNIVMAMNMGADDFIAKPFDLDVLTAKVQALCAQQQALETRMNAQYQDMLDYYTLWAHQIKTPIASMRLCLQQEDTPQARRLLQELSRAEQYVEMVMVYLRLNGGSDLVLREYELDAIVRRAVRRFAGEFIGRKLKLCYEPLNVSCVTDEKWLLFVIEQVLSNALKYTRAGSITIELEAPKTLVIRDTGIGVAPEDLPRIFEKGYTGYNGRGDQKASGLGLYLCRTICKRLGHTITASSVPDHGTAIRITLEQRQVRE